MVRRKELLVTPPTVQLHVGNRVWILREKRDGLKRSEVKGRMKREKRES